MLYNCLYFSSFIKCLAWWCLVQIMSQCCALIVTVHLCSAPTSDHSDTFQYEASGADSAHKPLPPSAVERAAFNPFLSTVLYSPSPCSLSAHYFYVYAPQLSGLPPSWNSPHHQTLTFPFVCSLLVLLLLLSVLLWSAFHCHAPGWLCSVAVVAMELQISHLSSGTLMDVPTVNRNYRLLRYLHLGNELLSVYMEAPAHVKNFLFQSQSCFSLL